MCGKDHIWQHCPDKRCSSCCQKGHLLKEWNSRNPSGAKHNILKVRECHNQDELSMTLPVKLNEQSLSVLVDSGTGPSVIDLHTVRNIGWETCMAGKQGQVFGLYHDPCN